MVSGCRAPRGRRSHGRVTSTRSSTSTRCARSRSELGVPGVVARPGSPARASLTRLPASDFAAGGSAPISRRASETGARSPRCWWRTAASASRSAASANAFSACGDGVVERGLVEQGDLLRVVRIVAVGHGVRALRHRRRRTLAVRQQSTDARLGRSPPVGVRSAAGQPRRPPTPAGWVNDASAASLAAAAGAAASRAIVGVTTLQPIA